MVRVRRVAILLAVVLAASCKTQAPPDVLVREDPAEEKLALARGHLDLFLGAWLARDHASYGELKSAFSRQLDGNLRDPRNFQLLIQDIVEEFRSAARLAEPGTEQAIRAAALEKYCQGLQGVLFRSKKNYFLGRDAVTEVESLRILDDLLAGRDLIEEVLERSPSSSRNWQHILLTVVGRVCSDTAARMVEHLCTAGAFAKGEDTCPQDVADVPTDVRKAAAADLSKNCKLKMGDISVAGMDAIRMYYDSAFERLSAASSTFPPPLAARTSHMAAVKEDAYKALEQVFPQ